MVGVSKENKTVFLILAMNDIFEFKSDCDNTLDYHRLLSNLYVYDCLGRSSASNHLGDRVNI